MFAANMIKRAAARLRRDEGHLALRMGDSPRPKLIENVGADSISARFAVQKTFAAGRGVPGIRRGEHCSPGEV